MKYLLALTGLGLALFFWACDKGEALPNQAPDTKIFVDEIKLSGDDRLNSFVRLHWLGEDLDGYVAGYELSFDSQNWFYTTQTDSLFRLDLPLGADSTDIDFFARSIDNEGLADQDPAYLKIPIKNSPPIALFDTLKTIPDTVLGAWSVLWSTTDLDGLETLDSVYLKINDGQWYPLDARINFVSLIPENPTQPGLQNLQLFAGLISELQAEPLTGVLVGEMNRMYLRARDIAGTFSETDSSTAFFLRQQMGDLLVIDAHSDPAPDPVYESILETVYPNRDRYDLVGNIPPFWEPTFEMLLNQYDKIFWYGDDGEIQEQLLLEIASAPIQEYLNAGGKLFLTAKFPSSLTDDPETANQSPIFGFSPMDSLSTAPGQARIKSDTAVSNVFPKDKFSMDYPPLFVSQNIISADPFYSKDTLQDIYTANLIPVSGWFGPSTVCGRTFFDNGETNQVFWSVELHRLDSDRAALEQVFSQVLLEEFNW